jgi:hypothetical protein
MFKKIIAVMVLVCFITSLQGCYSKHQIHREQLEQHPEYRIAKVVTVDGEVIEFDTELGSGAALRGDEIEGFTKEGSFKIIPYSQVKMLYIQKLQPVETFFAVIGVSALMVGGIVLIILATKESCPFVYSFNGKEYVFDGEPYGGAICQGLQRTDLCRLEYLSSVTGEYHLQLTNEVNETQYTDEFKLWVVDHPTGMQVIPDAEGRLYTVDHLQKPLLLVDSHGKDWYRWLSEKDLLYWESDVLSKDPNKTSDLYDTLFIVFQRPVGAQKAKLVANGCTTLWGSQMLKRIIELRGDQVRQWYEELKIPVNQERLRAWVKREEIYRLQVKVWVHHTWVNRGEIVGGGPFIAEERIIPLDLEGVEGDSLKILLSPPVGFWQLNSFAVDYSQDVPLEVQEISATSILGQDGADLRSILESLDGKYYVMPEIGQHALLIFPVPPSKPGLERSIFAKVSGYYDMHLNASGPPQTETIDRIASEPGYVVSFSLQEYFKWRSQELTKTEK